MGNKSKKCSKGLTIKQQETLLQDLTNMTALVVAYQKFVEEKGILKEAKEFIKKFIEEASRKVKK